MRRFIIYSGFVLLILGVIVVLTWRHYTSQHVFKTMVSPNGNIVVSIARKRNNAYPVKEGVDVWVVIFDKNGMCLLRKMIDTCDKWQDIEVQYHDIIFNDKKIFVGPEYWDGEKLSYYIIDEAELLNLRK